MPRGVYPRKRRGGRRKTARSAAQSSAVRTMEKRHNTQYARQMNVAADALLNAARLLLNQSANSVGAPTTITARSIVKALGDYVV